VRAVAPLVWVMLGLFSLSEALGRLLFYGAAVPVRPAGTFF
jgi:hypothetical protein